MMSETPESPADDQHTDVEELSAFADCQAASLVSASAAERTASKRVLTAR